MTQKIVNIIPDKMDKEIEKYRKGEIGEEKVIDILRQSLDGNWHLFHNIEIPGSRSGDIDVILIGPKGVFALEVKAYTGEYRNIGEKWEYRSGSSWKTAETNPSVQARKNAVRFSAFLEADDINQWIVPVVVWVNADIPLSIENPTVKVWLLDNIANEIARQPQNNKLSEEIKQRIVEKLTKLCQQQDTPGES